MSIKTLKCAIRLKILIHCKVLSFEFDCLFELGHCEQEISEQQGSLAVKHGVCFFGHLSVNFNTS